MVPADAIRRKAHRTASSTTGNTANYNPFARVRSKELADPEQMGRAQSESSVLSNIEQTRQLEGKQAHKDFPPPKHAGTEPPISPTSAGGSSEKAQGPIDEKDFANTNGGPSKESADISDKTIVGSGSGPGVTKRAKFKSIFRKGHEDDDSPEHHQVESEKLSLEERKKMALKRKIPVGQQIKTVLFGPKINILLLAVPAGFGCYYGRVGAIPTFVVNFIAIIPLAAMLS